MRGLGATEYAALTLHTEQSIDQWSWTLLLKDYKNSTAQLVPSVAYIGDQYKLELDEEIGLFDDEQFRPAVEVK